MLNDTDEVDTGEVSGAQSDINIKEIKRKKLRKMKRKKNAQEVTSERKNH